MKIDERFRLDKPKQDFYWRCLQCGMAYDIKPKVCTRCGYSKFTKSSE